MSWSDGSSSSCGSFFLSLLRFFKETAAAAAARCLGPGDPKEGPFFAFVFRSPLSICVDSKTEQRVWAEEMTFPGTPKDVLSTFALANRDQFFLANPGCCCSSVEYAAHFHQMRTELIKMERALCKFGRRAARAVLATPAGQSWSSYYSRSFGT